MSGPLKAAWVLTAFVVIAGLVLWLVTGKVVFAVFIVLGLLTGMGAWMTGRMERTSKKEIP
jgi:ABC-type bacteriocin/lantibiotic exporter with double-glycine peptidase domain